MLESLWNVPPHPLPHKKVHHNFIITIFDSHTMYCDFCAWTICGSKKGDIQLEGTLTKYQSFRTVLKKIYHLLLTIFNWDQFRRWGFLQFDTHISNANTAICFNKQWHFLCSIKTNQNGCLWRCNIDSYFLRLHQSILELF